MNLSEKLTAQKAALKAKSARLEEILKGADDLVLTDALKTERTDLANEVKEIVANISSLEALEATAATLAQPVRGKSIEEASQVRAGDPVGRVQVDPPKLPPGIEFARFLICKMASIVSQRDMYVPPIDFARKFYPDNPRIQMLFKVAVPGGTTTDGGVGGPGWAGPLVYPSTLVSEFIEFLRPQTIIGKFGTGTIPSLRRVPFNIRIVGQSSGGAGYWVGEARPKPLTKFQYTAGTLTWAKVANIAVFSDELARFSSPAAEGLVRDGLASALIERMDIDFVDPNKAIDPGVSPGSITNGIVGLISAGTDAAAVRADLQALFTAFITANLTPSSGVFIMSEITALALTLMMNALGQPEFPGMTMKGGTLVGLPVIASQYCSIGSPADYIVILVNAQDIFLADDGQVTVDVSREASLEMDDAPEGSPEHPGGLISMFQTNQLALRAERYINWARRRVGAVAWIDNVAWGTGSP